MSLWSPVIILTFIPALLHFSIASFAFSFGGSIIPIIPDSVSSLSISPSGIFSILSFGFISIVLYASASTLKLLLLIFSNLETTFSLISSSIILIVPLSSMYLHKFKTISGAPFV